MGTIPCLETGDNVVATSKIRIVMYKWATDGFEPDHTCENQVVISQFPPKLGVLLHLSSATMLRNNARTCSRLYVLAFVYREVVLLYVFSYVPSGIAFLP